MADFAQQRLAVIFIVILLTSNPILAVYQHVQEPVIINHLSQNRLVVNKCCPAHLFYQPWLDVCRLGAHLHPLPGLPPIYSSTGNSTTNLLPELGSIGSDKLVLCPEGHVVRSSTEFQLYDDGSLRVWYAAGHEQLEPKSFCINRIVKVSQSDADFAVRFCTPDPCAGGRCIRKCCPHDMILNNKFDKCQQTAATMLNGTPFFTGSMVQDGIGPTKCFKKIKRSFLLKNEFRITSDGWLNDTSFRIHYANESDRLTDHFCLEHFHEDNDHNDDFMVKRAFPF